MNNQVDFIPQNEMGVIYLFSLMQDQLGCELVEIRSKFPDAKIKKDGRIYEIEFEFKASNFILHKHNPKHCDLIVCWEHDLKKGQELNVPVLCLSAITDGADVKSNQERWRLIDTFNWIQDAGEIYTEHPEPETEKQPKHIGYLLTCLALSTVVSLFINAIQLTRQQSGTIAVMLGVAAVITLLSLGLLKKIKGLYWSIQTEYIGLEDYDRYSAHKADQEAERLFD